MPSYARVHATERLVARDLALEITLEVVPSLDEAMDQLCAELEREDLTRDPASFDLCPYFGVVWPSARALALELLAGELLAGELLAGELLGRGSLDGVSTLELGCGLGLPALVAAKLGARVTATDFHPDVPSFLAQNQALNGVSLTYVDADLRREGAERAALGDRTFALVLASDLLYDAEHALPVAAMLARRCAPEGRILLADPGRPHLEPCLRELERLGFSRREQLREVQGTAQLGSTEETVAVYVIELRREGAGPISSPPTSNST